MAFWNALLVDVYKRQISLFGHDWAPLALSTWLLPLALFAGGLLACRWALALWRSETEAAPVLETAK